MVRKKEHERLKQLLSEAILVLCKASLSYRTQFNIEGLLGITVDNEEIFLLNLNQHVPKTGPTSGTGEDSCAYHKYTSDARHSPPVPPPAVRPHSPGSPPLVGEHKVLRTAHCRRSPSKRPRLRSSPVPIKQEQEEGNHGNHVPGPVSPLASPSAQDILSANQHFTELALSSALSSNQAFSRGQSVEERTDNDTVNTHDLDAQHADREKLRPGSTGSAGTSGIDTAVPGCSSWTRKGNDDVEGDEVSEGETSPTPDTKDRLPIKQEVTEEDSLMAWQQRTPEGMSEQQLESETDRRSLHDVRNIVTIAPTSSPEETAPSPSDGSGPAEYPTPACPQQAPRPAAQPSLVGASSNQNTQLKPVYLCANSSNSQYVDYIQHVDFSSQPVMLTTASHLRPLYYEQAGRWGRPASTVEAVKQEPHEEVASPHTSEADRSQVQLYSQTACEKCGRQYMRLFQGENTSSRHTCFSCDTIRHSREMLTARQSLPLPVQLRAVQSYSGKRQLTQTSSKAKKAKDGPPAPPKTYRCVFCMKHFQNRRRLINHMCTM